MVVSSTDSVSAPLAGTGATGLLLPEADNDEQHLPPVALLNWFMELGGGRKIAVGSDGVHGLELWVTDSTEAGTVMLKDIHPSGDAPPGREPAGYPHTFTRLDDERALFVANDGVHHYSIWVTDGTPDGTRMVTDLFPGGVSSAFKEFVPLGGGQVAFVAWEVGKEGTSAGVWVTDGTAEGTSLLRGGLSYFDVDGIGLADGQAIFREGTGYGGKGTYWVTDGTQSGTKLLDKPWDDFRDPPREGDMARSADGKVIVPVLASDDGGAAGAFWITDGTKAGSHLLTEVPEGALIRGGYARYTDLGDGRTLINASSDGATLAWVTDGTTGGTHQLRGDWGGAGSSEFIPVGGGRAIHVEQEGGERGPSAIWLFDGSERVLLKAAGMDNPPADQVTFRQMADGRTVFIGIDHELGRKELWVTDGTAAGTKLVEDDYRGGLPTTLPPLEGGGDTGCGCPPEPGTPTQPGTPVAHDWSAANGLFDVAHYLSKYTDVAASGSDPLAHFMQFGAAEGRDPNSHFDVSFYLNQNPDVLAAGVNALGHYMSAGWKEGRDASFSFDGAAYLEANADVASSGMNPLEHFLRHGEAEGREAFQAVPKTTGPQNALMDASFYYATYGDVAKEGLDATQHFMSAGWMEGRDANAFFDTDWYLATYQDVAKAGMNPLEHYLTHGAAEHRDPSAAFDGDAYLARHADVVEAGMNPLEHYLQFGRAEGRDIFAG